MKVAHVVLWIFLLGGCSLPGGTTVEQTPARIEVEGRLEQSETGCPFLTTAEGRLGLLFVDSQVLERPLRVLSSSGEVLATVGDNIRVAGPDSPGESVCGVG